MSKGRTRVARIRFQPSGFQLWASGSDLEYLVSLDPPMCTCPDFSFRLARGTPSPCKHIRAVLAASYWGTYEDVEVSDERLADLLKGSISIGQVVLGGGEGQSNKRPIDLMWPPRSHSLVNAPAL